MSRNNRRGGGPRPFGNQPSHGLAPSGPLMNQHLELDDLDLELALLKRKRELIEKQQSMLVIKQSMPGPSQLNFGQGFGQQYNQTRDFSHFYDNAPGQNSFGSYGGQGVKRPIQVWDQDPSPKRFNGPKPRGRGPSQPSGFNPGRPQHFSGNNPRPKFGPGPKNRPDITPSKVTKPKQKAAPPNKLKSYPTSQRTALIAQTPRTKDKVEPLMYEADKPCSPKLVGRLELALGSILREIRDQHGSSEPHASTLLSVECLRIVKQHIRERIHGAMIGKTVGSCADIVEEYRREHPKDTDLALLEKAVATASLKTTNLSIEVFDSASPTRFFKLNFNRLLNKCLFDMFDKLRKIYDIGGWDDKNALRKEMHEIKEQVYEEMAEIKATEQATNETSDGDTVTTKSGSTEAIEEDTTVGESNTAADKNTTVTDENTKADESTTNSEENNTPAAEDTTENSTVSGENDTSTTESATDKKDEEKTIAPAENNTTAAKTEKAKPKLDASTKAKIDQVTKDTLEMYTIKNKFYEHMVETMIKKSLPALLPKYKDHLHKLLDADKTFQTTKAYLVNKTNEKSDKLAENFVKNVETIVIDDEPKIPNNPPFYVRVTGRPTLPDKKTMKQFLATFNPSVIKKHKTIDNILFVAFNKKEFMINILAKTGTVLDNNKLEITISEQIKPKAKQAEDQHLKDDKSTASFKLDQDMDNQISELLSCIRGEEENKLKNVESPTKAQGNVQVPKPDEGPIEVDTSKSEESSQDDIIEIKDGAVNVDDKMDTEATEEVVEADANIGNGDSVQENADVELNGGANGNDDVQDVDNEDAVKDVDMKDVDDSEVKVKEDDVQDIKNDEPENLEDCDTVKALPRRSTRSGVATPSSIKTRRASKLNN